MGFFGLHSRRLSAFRNPRCSSAKSRARFPVTSENPHGSAPHPQTRPHVLAAPSLFLGLESLPAQQLPNPQGFGDAPGLGVAPPLLMRRIPIQNLRQLPEAALVQ